MKLVPTLALGAILTLSAGIADAAPRSSRGHGHAPPPPPSHHEDSYRGNRIEARAQLRLRQLGYYHGRIDGSFGRASRTALIRFQHDRRLPMHGRLDGRTLRALGIR